MAVIKNIHWKNVQFIASGTKKENYPKMVSMSGTPLPEIAVAGRSNVGKSTLLNDLFQNKKLVKTSAQPGKTQLINFFSMDDKISFVDLPGYGYAQVPLHIKKKWGPMIQEYLNSSKQLSLILFLLDIRRVPNEDDLLFLDWAAFSQKPILLILTKIDKVSINEKAKNTKKILDALPYKDIFPIHYSAHSGEGKVLLQQQICTFLQEHTLRC